MNRTLKYLLIFISLYGITSIAIWKRYNFNPTSMVNFGYEFAIQNKAETPAGSIVFKGERGDLGAGYDGQIFYYFSRPISNFNLDWPKGFDESYRAPRIGFPLLISVFGLFGSKFAIFGMYFWILSLHFLSFLALRELVGSEFRLWTLLYLVSPFALGSYSVLVSDSVMVSLVVIGYYFLTREKYWQFSLLGGLAIITKEPALFFLFPIGLRALSEKNFKKILAVASTLLIPILWHAYLRYAFPNWSATRLSDFILPLEGIKSYLLEIEYGLLAGEGFRPLARLLGRFPLVLLFVSGVALLFHQNLRRAWEMRIAFGLVMLMIGIAGHYHFWSVYENISRMFTLSIPILILWKKEDNALPIYPYAILTIVILFLFIIKLLFISQPLPHLIWN
ncbi:AZOBR_p60025 family cell surface glycopolymer formation protein [Leptospira sp. GIMC2001]|uniref:AZOBR_p60025 family cell surface glycopolymer formation protein n=1 Tax=Leptospira sp. GIMC2001 TaxID=1513297 RepID=UPI00234B99EB|nr:hypothetical protein [Leptospira sp. GIMC2001]WCL47563.1 hypothetical protein O4O04_00940 [Leptospira sp. GIMC2001]